MFENNDIIDSCEKAKEVKHILEEKMGKTKSKKMQTKKKADAKTIFKHVLRGLRNAAIFAAIIIVLLLVGSLIVTAVTKTNLGRNMYLSCYYGAIFVLIVSIPQFYKRKKIGKGRQVRQMDTMFGFYGWFSVRRGWFLGAEEAAFRTIRCFINYFPECENWWRDKSYGPHLLRNKGSEQLERVLEQRYGPLN